MRTTSKETASGTKTILDDLIDQENHSVMDIIIENYLPILEETTMALKEMGIDLKDTYFLTKNREDANAAGRQLGRAITSIEAIINLSLKSRK